MNYLRKDILISLYSFNRKIHKATFNKGVFNHKTFRFGERQKQYCKEFAAKDS